MKEIFGGRYGIDEEGGIYSLRNNAGNVRRVPLPMKTRVMRGGYVGAHFFTGNSGRARYICASIHRLVAEAFLSNPLDKPEVNHKNGNKLDNRAVNLEWVTSSENSCHAFRTGLRVANKSLLGKFNEEHPGSKPIRAIPLNGGPVLEFPSMREAQRQGFSQGNITAVIQGARRSHKGYTWELI
jgi:hypothetical protein